MPLITELFCFAMFDKDKTDEGIPAFQGPGNMVMPMMGADMTRVEQIMPIAQQAADETGETIRIYKFSQKEQIGEITPRKLPPDTTVVHGLASGIAVCGFAVGAIPANWPAGHVGVSAKDEADQITCPKCRHTLDRCFDCNAPLAGSLTKHTKDCSIGQLIHEAEIVRLPEAKFPILIEALNSQTQEVVWSTRIEKPDGLTALRVPQLRKPGAPPLTMRTTFGDGEVEVTEYEQAPQPGRKPQ